MSYYDDQQAAARDYYTKNPYIANMAGYNVNDPNAKVSGKKTAPPPPDFMGGADRDLQANRPNQTNAFGSGVQWSQDANGNWTQSQSFGGPFGALSGNLMGQAASNMSTPMDWSQFGKLGTGDDARNQAIESAYTQATTRLNPQWAARDESLQAQLANQGLDPQTSAAGRMAQFQQGQAKNDAYGSAMSNAIAQGTAAGDSVFRNNMAARQQAIAEALKQRGMPMSELGQMQGFLQQPGYNSDANRLAAMLASSNYDLNAWQGEMDAKSDIFGGLFGGLGSLAGGLFGGRKR